MRCLRVNMRGKFIRDLCLPEVKYRRKQAFDYNSAMTVQSPPLDSFDYDDKFHD